MWELSVNGIALELLPKLKNQNLDPEVELIANIEVNNMVINYKGICSHALFQENLDQIISPSNPMRSLKIDNM